MKRTHTLYVFGLTALSAHSAFAFNPVVNQTVGTGANESYFVINFNDGPNFANNPASNYIFGYKYTGTKTGEDLILALQSSLPTFSVSQTYYASFNDYSTDTFSYKGHSQTGNYNLNQSYWAYFTSSDAQLSQSSSNWDYAQSGPQGRTLANNSYDGWSFAANGNSPTPVTAPEPNALSVLAIGTLGLVSMRRRRCA